MRERLIGVLTAASLMAGTTGCTVGPKSYEGREAHTSVSPTAEGQVTTSLEGVEVHEDTAVFSPTDHNVVAMQASDRAHNEPVIVIEKDGETLAVIRNAYSPRWQPQPRPNQQADLAFTTGLKRGEVPGIALYNPYRNEVVARMSLFSRNGLTAGWEGTEFVQRQGTQRQAIADPNPTRRFSTQ